MVSTVALLMDKIEKVRHIEADHSRYKLEQTQATNDFKFMQSNHDRQIQDLYSRLEKQPSRLEFRNFENRFEAMKDDMTFLKADFDFKLDPNAGNILSDRNVNNSN